MEDTEIVPGEFVLKDLFSEFTYQVNKKVESLLTESLTQDSRQIMKSLQRGEDSQFDQLLGALGCVAEHCLPSLLETLFKWFSQCVPTASSNVKIEGKSSRSSGVKSKSDNTIKEQDQRKELKEMVISIVFCLVLIEVLEQLPVHPLPENQIQHVLTLAFTHFRNAAMLSTESPNNKARIVADLFAEVIGVMAKTKFQYVRSKFMVELEAAKKSDNNTRIILGLIMGMKFFRVKMYPVEDFEASFRFLRELADYSLEVKDRETKHGLASLFVEILVPVAAAVKTEVNVPVLRDFVDALYPTSLELSRRRKNQLAMYPLVTCLLCVSQKQFFLNNWHIFLDNCLSNLKNRDQKISRVALESLYRLLWAYTVRVKCESNTATQSRLQSVVKTLFPAGSRSVVPKDTPLSIYVKIIQFIAQERLDFAMKEIILDLLCISLTSSRNTKIITLQPERMNIGLRAFLVITDSLQQKDGAPPMPTTVGVMPSGNTLRVKKTFLNKMLTEDEARTIGVLHYHKHVQKALDWILTTLDSQVGQRMMMTNRTLDVIGTENKPKIDLFRTCIAAMPRLIPSGSMSLTELFELLSRLTIHIDEDLRSQAFTSLLSFAQDFPDSREDVVASFVSFILKQVTDIHNVLLDTALKHLMQLISGWRNKSINTFSNSSLTSRPHLGKLTDSHERRSRYSPLINHLQGFALVLLCSNRSVTRKLSCLLLKEVKTLARTLNYKKSNEELCIDVLDRFCPAVATEVIIDQEVSHNLSTAECQNVLAVSEKCDITTLVECISACSPRHNVDLWTSFIASLMKPHRVPAFCPTAVEFSWPNVNIRLNQLWQHMDPMQTSSNKKAATLPSSSDNMLSLWTNYTVFACRCAPTNVSLNKKQGQSAIAAGTPDWLLTLSRDSERITTTPSALFQRLITLLRMESNLALRDSAVVGLGSTGTVAFPDLMTELITVIHEACKAHRQDNMRRRRKRDNTRVMLSRVLERLARHKVLSQCSSTNIVFPSQTQKTNDSTLGGVLLDYIKDTCTFLESVDKSEFVTPTSSGSSQQPQQILSSPFPGTLSSSGTSLQTQSSTPNSMDELRIHFGSMIIYLVRHLPDHMKANFIPNETRRVLFFLFGRWCGKYGDALDCLDVDGEKRATNAATQLHITALKAECAVLCCGPVFDLSGLQKNTGYLYPWLEAFLDYSNPKIHRYGQEAIIMLLRHNKDVPALMSWLIDKCYTGSHLVASGCFCSIAAAFNYLDLSSNMIELLNLALFSIANSDESLTAQHLLMMIQSRIVSSEKLIESKKDEEDDGVVPDGNDKNPSLQLHLNIPYERMYTPPLYSLSQFDISKDLARLHPEFTIAMLSEIFKRFMLTTTTVWQQLMLQYMLPWLKNVELTLHEEVEKVPELNNSEKMFDHPLHTLRSCGWGSVDATLFVLSNLTFITIRYHAILGTEIEQCWSTLCHTWPGNLDVLLIYTSALSACAGCDSIAFVTRKLITFFARAKSKEVAQYLVKECQIADTPDFGIQILDHPPYFKIEIQDIKTFTRIRPVPSSSPPRSISSRTMQKSQRNALCSSAPVSYPRTGASKSESTPILISPNARNGPNTAKHSTLKHSAPHHMSLQQLNIGKTNDFDGSPKRTTRPMFARHRMSDSLYSLPNLSTEASLSVSPKSAGNIRISHPDELGSSHLSPKWLSAKEEKIKVSSKARVSLKTYPAVDKPLSFESTKPESANLPDTQTSVFAKWRKDIELGYPRSLPLSTSPMWYLQLNEYFAIDHIEKSNGLLRSNIACVLLSEIVVEHDVVLDWKVYLPTLLLSLFLCLDVEYEQVPQKCQFLLAHIIIQLMSAKDQAVFASSVIMDTNEILFDDTSNALSHLKKGTTPTSVCTTDSGIEATPLGVNGVESGTCYRRCLPRGPKQPQTSGNSQHQAFIRLYRSKDNALLKFEVLTNDHSTNRSFDIHALTSYIKRLLKKTHGRIWLAEDASPKATILRSTEQLREYVTNVVAVIGSLVPDFCLTKKLAKEALKFAVKTNNKHCAGRALQVFRSLRLPLRQNDISELSLSLSECIADGNDASSQSWAIEILLTLLQTCEISTANLSKEENKPNTSQQIQASSSPPTPKPATPIKSDTTVASTTSVKNKKMLRRGHVHRRSGSVSISKQVLEEAKSMECNLSPPSESHLSCTDHPPAEESTVGQQKPTVNGNFSLMTSAVYMSRPSSTLLPNAVDEWKNGLAQIFWIAVGILESDFEHEYLIALHIIRRALLNLKLNELDGRIRLERLWSHDVETSQRAVALLSEIPKSGRRSFNQIEWHNYKGLQSLLLKGLTCNTTFETAFSILFNLTTVTHLPVVSSYQNGSGFAINVIALLPRLVNQFGDPDSPCCECAQNIAQVCVDYFKDYIKLQSLAHVMSLYSNNTYNKSVQTWINAVCKYVYETFPQALAPQLTFLSEMLEKGHPSFHLASLHVVLSLLSLSPVLTEQADDKLIHELLHVVLKHLNGKHWKEALNILKLAVSRSSQLASPAAAFTVTQGDDDKEKIELPGLTLSFKYDLSGSHQTPQHRSPDGKEVSSPVGTGWRRPHLSQRRTRERLRCVLSVCSMSQIDDGRQHFKNGVEDEPSSPSHMSDTVNESSCPETEDSFSEDKGGLDDVQFHGVFRDFDFLNEIEENEGESTDNFNTGMHWSTSNSSAAVSNEVIGVSEIEEPPDECDLTPAMFNVTKDEDVDSDSASVSSLASSVSCHQDPDAIERYSNELLASGSEEENQSKPIPSGSGISSTLATDSAIKTHKRKSSSTSTYIRAVSPSPPGLMENQPLSSPQSSSDDHVFTSQQTITEQVNAVISDSECISTDENVSIDGLDANDLSLSFGPSSDPPPEESAPLGNIKSNPSPTPFNSVEQRSESIESLTNLCKSEMPSFNFWNEISPLHAKNLRWKACLLAVSEDTDGSSLSRFFIIFPSIYRNLCVDFSVLSKDGCTYLGSQLSSISNHFSSMVDDLPKQLECPLCLATQNTYLVLISQLKSYVADLEEQLDFYSSKQEDTSDCLAVVRALFEANHEPVDDSALENPAQLDQKQLELCRLLYTLHFQLLLIFQSFNRLVHVIVTSLPQLQTKMPTILSSEKGATFSYKQLDEEWRGHYAVRRRQDNKTCDSLISLHKHLSSQEKCKDDFAADPSTEVFTSTEENITSMTNEEGRSSLFSSLLKKDFMMAQVQLCILRKLWPMEPFGCADDSGSDFLTQVYFQETIGADSSETLYVIIGENAGAQGLCEKLMEVNMQIQHSLQLLEKPRGGKVVEAKPQPTNGNHSKSEPIKRTSF